MTMTELEEPATARELARSADIAIETTSLPASYDELLAEADAWKNGRPLSVPDEKFRLAAEIWRATKKSEWWVLAGTGWLAAAAFFSSPWYLLAALGYFGLTGVGSHVVSARREHEKRLKEQLERNRELEQRINPHKLIVEHLQTLLQGEKDRFLSDSSTLCSIERALGERLAAALKRSEQFGIIEHDDERAGRTTDDFVLEADERNRETVELLTSARDRAETVIAKFKAHFAKMETEVGSEAGHTSRYELVAEVARENEEAKELVARANESEYQTMREFIMRMVVFREMANRALQSVCARELASVSSGDIKEYLKSLDREIDKLVAATPEPALMAG